jgi:hypothetical protein
LDDVIGSGCFAGSGDGLLNSTGRVIEAARNRIFETRMDLAEARENLSKYPLHGDGFPCQQIDLAVMFHVAPSFGEFMFTTLAAGNLSAITHGAFLDR